MTLDAAQRVVDGARAKADEIGVPMNIAVVDDGNNLTAFARMDGTWLGSIDIAQNKAYTCSRPSRWRIDARRSPLRCVRAKRLFAAFGAAGAPARTSSPHVRGVA
jgi:uncharacterized protein GlcG (DUF336 family)